MIPMTWGYAGIEHPPPHCAGRAGFGVWAVTEPRLCPSCGANLDGELIWRTFYDQGRDEREADRMAAKFGATRTEGRWSRAIALYSIERDCTDAFQCPDCGHEWRRKDNPNPD